MSQTQQLPPPPGQAAPAHRPGSGLAVTALVLGILGALVALIPLLGVLGLVLGVLALVFGLIGHAKARRGQAAGKGMALAGTILGALAIAFGILGIVVLYNAVEEFDEAFQELDDQLADLEPAPAEAAGPEDAGGADEPSGDEQADPDGAASGSDDPLPLGTAARVGDWEVVVEAVDVDATDEVVAANEFNEEPGNGAYVLVTTTATYHGDDEGIAALDLSVVLVGNDARHYADYDCEAVAPGSMMDEPVVASGGSASGTWCLDVPPAATEGAALFVEETVNFEDTRVYWALP